MKKYARPNLLNHIPVDSAGNLLSPLDSNFAQEYVTEPTRNDFVFGPTLDGGYWLTGARRGNLVRGIYKHVRWSSSHALNDTMRNTQGKKVSTLRQLRDIDDEEDYYEYIKSG